MKKIVVLGDFNPKYYTHHALNDAIKYLTTDVNNELKIEWVDTDKFDYANQFRTEYSGLWIAPGSPYKDMDNVINTIRFARKNNIPTLGNCGGFQHMIIEYARNVCGLINANTEETIPDGKENIISKLTCSLVGQQEEISVLESTLLHSLIEKNHLIGKYYCSYALNPDYVTLLESNGMLMTATNAEGEIRAFEISSHPFFLGTLFQPTLTSSAEEPDPVLMGFVERVSRQP